MRSKPRRFAITWETGSGYRSRGACNFRQAGKVISRYTENTRVHRPTRFVANPAVCKRAQTLAHASNVGWVIRGRILGGSFTREQAYSAFFPPTYRSLPPCLLDPCKRYLPLMSELAGETLRNIARCVAEIILREWISEFEAKKCRVTV